MKKNRKKWVSTLALAFVATSMIFQVPKGSADSYSTISGADSFDTPSLLASLVYTGIGEKNTFQQSIKVSSIGEYPTSSPDDVGSQSYGNLTIKDQNTTNTQGKALQSYIYTMDAMGLSGKFYDDKPTDAINTEGYAMSNNALFPHNNQGGDYHPFKQPISSAFDSMMLAVFQTLGSFWALFCDSGKGIIDKLVDMYASIPKFFASGGQDDGLLSKILDGIAGLFGVRNFFSGMRQMLAPYMFAIIILSLIGSALAIRRKRFGDAFSGFYHIVFRTVMFLSGFALLGWTYNTVIVPFQEGFSNINQSITIADTAKTKGIDALAWGVSSNFSLDPSVTGVALDQSALLSGKVQASLINNKQVIENINQHSIDVLGKTTLSALNSPLQDVVKDSKTPFQDSWDNQTRMSMAGTFSMDDYISGIEIAMKAGNQVEALNNPLQNNAGLRLVAGSYFSKETSDGGKNENFKDYYYGSPNNFNKDTYLFLPNSAYAGMASTDALQGNGGQQVKLVNPLGSPEGKDIKNLGNIYPFSAQKVDVKDTSSYLFNSEPTESKTKLVASTYIGSSQNVQFTDVSSTNRLAYNSNMDVTGIGSATDKDLNKLINNNAFQIILMNKEAGVNRGVSNNPNYFQLSTQSAVFFLSSSMSKAGALNFQYPYGKNLNGSQNNSAKTAFFNRIISVNGDVQVSNVISNSFKYALYALVYLSVIVTLVNTALLKKIIENIQSYISFLSGGHFVDYVSATTLALAFCLIGLSSMAALAFTNVIFTVVNAFLNGLFSISEGNAFLIFLWSFVSFLVTVTIIFLPVVPNAHSVLSGNAVKNAKAQRKAMKTGMDVAKTTGNAPLALGAVLMSAFAWITNKLTSSLPAVVTIAPMIIQNKLMEASAQKLVAVQDGGFIGNKGGVASKVDTVSEVLNKKMHNHDASNVTVGDLGEKATVATADALEKIGKTKAFLENLKEDPEDDNPDNDGTSNPNPNPDEEEDEMEQTGRGVPEEDGVGEEDLEGDGVGDSDEEGEELTPEQEELKQKEEELKATQEERLNKARKEDDKVIIEDKTGKYSEEEKELARQRRENANIEKAKEQANKKAKEEKEKEKELKEREKVEKELDREKELMASRYGLSKESIDDESAREHRDARVGERNEASIAEIKGRQRLARDARETRRSIPAKDISQHLKARRAEKEAKAKLREIEEENRTQMTANMQKRYEIVKRVKERREREKRKEE